MPNRNDRHDARVYSLHAPEIVGIDFAREGSDSTSVVVAARDGLGNVTFRPIIPASRGNLPTREELEREIRELAAAGRFPADLPEAVVRTEAQARIAQRERFEALRANLETERTVSCGFSVSCGPAAERIRARSHVSEFAPPHEADAVLERELRRRDLRGRTVRVLVHLRCPNARPDEAPLVVPSREPETRVCSGCSLAWAVACIRDARDLEAIELARETVPEIRFVEAMGNLERRESGRFSYGRPAEIPDEAEPLAPPSSALPEYRPR